MNTLNALQHKQLSTIVFTVVLCFFSVHAYSQDTIRVKKVRHYYDDCHLVICANNTCYTDSIPKALFETETKLELRMHQDCEAGKTNDIFVSSFQVELVSKGVFTELACSSSFFTEKQKQAIANKKVKSFKITSIQMHAPDGHRGMPDLEIMLK